MADKKRHKRKMPGNAKESRALPAGQVALYGLHAAKAALSNQNRHIHRAFMTKNAADRFANLLETRSLIPEIKKPEEISALTGHEAVHQGVVLICDPLTPLTIHDVSDTRLLVVLDQVTDPHNVGAIMRSAVALGAEGLVTTLRNNPKETGLLAKTASGGFDLIDHIEVPNLAQALVKLNDFGFTTVGLDSDGPQDMAESLYGDKIALVLGAEGSGLRRLTRERCDVLARLDMPGPIKSLNVSNAAVLSLYLAAQHLKR